MSARPALKRKAAHQMTRSTAEEHHTSDSLTMAAPQSTLSRVQIFLSSFFSRFVPGEMVPDDSSSTQNQLAERVNLSTTDKRVCREPESTRSQSIVNSNRDCTRKASLDLTTCKDEGEARKRIASYWEPPPLGSSTATAREWRPSTSDSTTGSSSQGRLSSEPSISSGSSITSPEITTHASSFRSSRSRARISQPTESMPQDISDALTLDRLLLDDDDVLEPATSKAKQRIEANKIRERERKEEEQRGFIAQAQQRRLRRFSPKKPLIEPLPLLWDDKVSQAQQASGNTILARSLAGGPLLFKDFSTLLGPRSWLNDEIINSYIEWIAMAANEAAAKDARRMRKEESTVPKFLAHNSFFWQNLRTKGPASTDRLMKRKKVPGTALLDVDTVFIPICQGNHWTIGTVRPIAKTIEYFDSMGGRSPEFFRHMRAWLQHQLGAKYKEEEWTTPKTACAVQHNGYDCGVFVLTNAFCVAAGIDTSCYMERDMILQRRRIAAVLINGGFKGDFAWGNVELLES